MVVTPLQPRPERAVPLPQMNRVLAAQLRSPKHDSSDVSASNYNVLDKKYFNPGRPEEPKNALPHDGRTFRMKLTARF